MSVNILISGLLCITSAAPEGIAHILISFSLATKQALKENYTFSSLTYFYILFLIWASWLVIRHLKNKKYDMIKFIFEP